MKKVVLFSRRLGYVAVDLPDGVGEINETYLRLERELEGLGIRVGLEGLEFRQYLPN